MVTKFVVSLLLVGLAFGLVVTVVFGVCYKSYDVYGVIYYSPNPNLSMKTTTTSFVYGSVYGFPLGWNTVKYYETSFLFGETNISYFLSDMLLWGVIGGVPLALWVVRREDMTWKAKLLKSTFLATSFVLLVFSPQYIFYMEKVPRTYPISLIPSPSSEYVWAFNIYYILFGVFLLAAGIVLTVASYYRHGETDLPMKI
jgi:hypothetical protein